MAELSGDNPEGCGNDHCKKCYPWPVFKVSRHRIQHITYQREIKAPSREAALAEFDNIPAHPSSYDDHYGEVISEDPVEVEQIEEYQFPEGCSLHLCWNSKEWENAMAEFQRRGGSDD